MGSSLAFGGMPSYINFREEKSDTSNPDRGFFSQIRVDNSLRFSPLEASVKNYRIYFVLNRFVGRLLPDEELKNLDNSLATVTHARQRVILRFIYDYPSAALVNSGFTLRRARTATPAMMSAHIRQLAGVIRRHAQAVFAVESGLIGFYGEQWGDAPDKETPSAVAAVVDQWRAELAGTEIQVLARYPKSLREYVDRNPDVLRRRPRLGFWNDCLGAYDDGNMKSAEVTVVEGETCSLRPLSDYSCPTMMAYFKRVQLDLLNSQFFLPTIERWAVDGCLDEIKRHLGYRFIIREARLASDGSKLELQIDNVGWGRSLISRPLYLVSNGRRIKRVADLEKFTPGSINRIDVKLDSSVDWASTELSLETDDHVHFSNTTGNLLFVPPSAR